MLAWLDIRKQRPVTGPRDPLTEPPGSIKKPEATAAGVDRAYIFSVWPQFSNLEADLDAISATWADMQAFFRGARRTGNPGGGDGGFDTSPYVMGILTEAIRWQFASEWRVGNADNESQNDRSSGSTYLDLNESGDDGPPFLICIELAADMVWPLLVDEYPVAEKAAASFLLANTMLHGLSVSFFCDPNCWSRWKVLSFAYLLYVLV